MSGKNAKIGNAGTIDPARLHRALNPRTVAVVGDKGPNYNWITNLKEFTGKVFSVQLDEKELPGILERGVPNFRSLVDIPEDIDLVICAVPRQVTPFIMKDAVAKGVGGISMFTSGFAETGEEIGVKLQQMIYDTCAENGMPLVGPNCMGIYNRRLGVKFTGAQEQGEGGEVGIVSQSGTHGIAMTIGSQRLGVKVTRAISIGNAVVLNEADYLEYMLNDPDVRVISMYLEGVRNGRKFFEVLKKATRQKPVIIWRGGRSRAGARAVRSHTGSLASDDAIWSALVKQAGAISVDTLEDAIDTIAALVLAPATPKRNLALVAMTGGQSVAITDQFERAGFEVPELSKKSYDILGEFFVTIGGSYRNPFDASSTIGRETDNLAKILEVLANERAIDGGVAFELGSRGFEDGSERMDQMLDLLRKYRDTTGLPVVALMPDGGVMGGDAEILVRARGYVSKAGFPVYPSFQRGAAALGRAAAYWTWRKEVGARPRAVKK
ncbi:MAG: CoA-binding protein [Dehalococcoidia bacterium]|nr:CoA-binding protein [Dehalococcoidia bacterium]